jgi:hypothetical protein
VRVKGPDKLVPLLRKSIRGAIHISLFYFVASNIGRKLASGVVRIAAEEQHDGGIRGSHVFYLVLFYLVLFYLMLFYLVFFTFVWGECSQLHHRPTEGEKMLINVAEPVMLLFKFNITPKSR